MYMYTGVLSCCTHILHLHCIVIKMRSLRVLDIEFYHCNFVIAMKLASTKTPTVFVCFYAYLELGGFYYTRARICFFFKDSFMRFSPKKTFVTSKNKITITELSVRCEKSSSVSLLFAD